MKFIIGFFATLLFLGGVVALFEGCSWLADKYQPCVTILVDWQECSKSHNLIEILLPTGILLSLIIGTISMVASSKDN